MSELATMGDIRNQVQVGIYRHFDAIFGMDDKADEHILAARAALRAVVDLRSRRLADPAIAEIPERIGSAIQDTEETFRLTVVAKSIATEAHGILTSALSSSSRQSASHVVQVSDGQLSNFQTLQGYLGGDGGTLSLIQNLTGNSSNNDIETTAQSFGLTEATIDTIKSAGVRILHAANVYIGEMGLREIPVPPRSFGGAS